MQSILASDQINGHGFPLEARGNDKVQSELQSPAPPADEEINRVLKIARSQDAMSDD
jgi:hypothetical protein